MAQLLRYVPVDQDRVVYIAYEAGGITWLGSTYYDELSAWLKNAQIPTGMLVLRGYKQRVRLSINASAAEELKRIVTRPIE